MAAKLYEVNLKYYVLAEDEQEAGYVLIDVACCDKDIGEAKSVDAAWYDALPFTSSMGESDRTCGEILAADDG